VNFTLIETALKISMSIVLWIVFARDPEWRRSGTPRFGKMANLLGFLHENVPEFEQNRKKPEKTCGNRRFVVDKALGKDEGELRYSSPDPHEH
jgi:hypothetical protein